MPRHVERYLRAAGVLAHGFVRVRCTGCGLDRLVAFACKGRAVCPSCRGRRMADVADRLVDCVLPATPCRQWTLSVPWRWRVALARHLPLAAAARPRLRVRRHPRAGGLGGRGRRRAHVHALPRAAASY